MTETLTGAQITIRLLERQGIRIVTGIPGRRHPADLRRARPIDRHPSRAGPPRTGCRLHRPGHGPCHRRARRLLASSGPGATNLLTAIADAKLDSIPLVAITGQVPKAMIGTDAFQEVDTYGLSIPITKHNFLVTSAEELLEVIPARLRDRRLRPPRPGADRHPEGRADPGHRDSHGPNPAAACPAAAGCRRRADRRRRPR
jgi:acetolactate synthase-1/2/3 large subunit